MAYSVLFALVVIVLLVIYYQLHKHLNYWSNRNVLVEKPSLPMGNLGGVGKTKHFNFALKDIYDKFVGKDQFCGFYFLTSPRALVLDLDLLKNIFIKDFQYFADRKMYHSLENDPLSAHLFNLRGHKWRLMRQQLSPTFTSGKMKMMYDLVANGSLDFVKAIDRRGGTDIDIKDISMRYVADVIGICAFGLECKSMENEDAEIIKQGHKVFEIDNFKFLFQSTFEGFAEWIGMRLFKKEGTDYFMSVITNSVKSREQSDNKRKDFLNLLIQLKNNGKLDGDNESESLGKISFNELAAQAFIFMAAGFETTSTSMQFCLAELAINQDIQAKARQEALRVKEKYNGKLTYESLNELEYLSRCIDESMRKWPSVGVLFRNTLKDYKVPNSDHIIEKETQILVPVMAIHNDPRHFPQPEKFDPDRFLPENVKNRHPMAFLAFGDGPRNCIGMRFAYLQMKLAMAELLTTFKLTMSPKTQLPMELDPKELFSMIKSKVLLCTERI